MNCKPGDLAIVVKDCAYLGMLVEILYRAPTNDFLLPDGVRGQGVIDSWVFRMLPGRYVPMLPRGTRFTEYGTGKDSALRPLRGLPETEKQDEEITA